MYDFYFNVWPEIFRHLLLNKIFEIALIIVVFLSLFFAMFFMIKIFIYKMILNKVRQKNQDFIKNIVMYYQSRLNKLHWKKFIKELISFTENFQCEKTYNNIRQIFQIIGINKENEKEIFDCIYKDQEISEETVNKIKHNIKNL